MLHFVFLVSHLRIERSSKLRRASSRADLEEDTRLRLKTEAALESYPLTAAATWFLWNTYGLPPPPLEATRLDPRLSPCSPDELGLLPEATALLEALPYLEVLLPFSDTIFCSPKKKNTKHEFLTIVMYWEKDDYMFYHNRFHWWRSIVKSSMSGLVLMGTCSRSISSGECFNRTWESVADLLPNCKEYSRSDPNHLFRYVSNSREKVKALPEILSGFSADGPAATPGLPVRCWRKKSE